MDAAIAAIGRTPRQRTTLYGTPDPTRTELSYGAAALADPVNPPFNDGRLRRPKRLVRPGLDREEPSVPAVSDPVLAQT